MKNPEKKLKSEVVIRKINCKLHNCASKEGIIMEREELVNMLPYLDAGASYKGITFVDNIDISEDIKRYANYCKLIFKKNKNLYEVYDIRNNVKQLNTNNQHLLL